MKTYWGMGSGGIVPGILVRITSRYPVYSTMNFVKIKYFPHNVCGYSIFAL